LRNAYIVLAEKRGWKRPLGRLTNVSKDNIKMNLNQDGRVGVDWVYWTENGER
jgi:hypothetical protein